MQIQMTDSFVVDDVRRTSDGYLTAFAKVARTGIQEYRGSEIGMPDKEIVRVYRPPEEVFHADAMRSFAHRPVTLKHPRTPVTAKNWKKFAGGQTGDQIVRDGEYVRVPLVLMDANIIRAYEEDGVKQLSMGYSCDIEICDGVTPAGERYDAIQKSIRGNHLAVVPLARGGDQLRIGDSYDDDEDDDEDDDNKKKKDMDEDDCYDGVMRTLGVEDWSDESRAAALEARQAAAHHRDMANKHLLRHVDAIKSERDQHDKAYEAHDKASNAFRRAHEDYKAGNMKSGDKYSDRGKELGSRADKMSARLHVRASDAAVDYVACPQCGANVEPDAHECPGCGHIMQTRDHKQGEEIVKTIVVDGLNVGFADEQSASIVKRTIEKLETKVTELKDSKDKAKAEVKDVQAKLADATAAVSAKDGEIAVLNKKLADAELTQEKIDAMVKDQLAVIAAASPLLAKDFAFDGKSPAQIRRAVVDAHLGDAAKDMDDAAIGGAFVTLTADNKKNNTGGVNPIRNALKDAGGRAKVTDAETAWNERNARLNSAWKNKATA